MKPSTIITRVIVFLLLGTIVNVAVAWGCVVWNVRIGLTGGLVSQWIRDAQGNVTAHATVGFLRMAGLPLRTFEAYFGEDFPSHPLWPGFAINTLFYAAILWMLFAAPFALRRRRRIKRGLCPACAYPVGDSTVCTECGRPLTSAM